MKQKRASTNKSSTNKQSNGPAGSNDDSLRAAILDEATIVYISCLCWMQKEKQNAMWFF